MMYSLDDGKFAVKTARKIIEAAVSGEEFPAPEPPKIFKDKSGVFVTINTFPKHNLIMNYYSLLVYKYYEL